MRAHESCRARENARDQVADGFDFVSDWLRRWRELLEPIIALTYISSPLKMFDLSSRAVSLKASAAW